MPRTPCLTWSSASIHRLLLTLVHVTEMQTVLFTTLNMYSPMTGLYSLDLPLEYFMIKSHALTTLPH